MNPPPACSAFRIAAGCALVLVMLISPHSPAATAGREWIETLTETPAGNRTWKSFDAEYSIGWARLEAARAKVSFRANGPSYRFEGSGGTTGFVRTLWRCDATQTSSGDLRTAFPRELAQQEEYRNKTVQTKVTFAPRSFTRTKVETPAPAKLHKAKTYKLPHGRDMQSALLYLRSLPLNDGDVIRLLVFPGTTPAYAVVTVAGREPLNTPRGKVPAIRLDLELRKVDKDLALRSNTKFRSASGWLSDDADRIPLRIESDVFIGTVYAQLTALEFK